MRIPSFVKNSNHCHYVFLNGFFSGPSGVRALPLAADINEGGHYFRYISSFLVGTIVQNPRRGCRRVSNF